MFSYENRIISIRIDDYIIFVDDISRIKKIVEGIKIFHKSGGESVVQSDDPDQLFNDVFHRIKGE